MDNYNHKDKKARRYALLVTLLLLLLFGLYLGYGVFNIDLSHKKDVPPAEIVIEEFEEFEEEIEKPAEVQSPSENVREERATTAHVEEASVEQHEQTEGAKPETQTLNNKAMFKPVVGNVEELQPEGNRLASNGDQESNRGEGGGYNLIDSGSLDEGLSGRGLREQLPKPSVGKFNWNATVVVYVQIDGEGNVVAASIEQRGTTTSDAKIIDAVLKAAKSAKFMPSDRAMQAGRITYEFKVTSK